MVIRILALWCLLDVPIGCLVGRWLSRQRLY
jgi:hypothetical protein